MSNILTSAERMPQDLTLSLHDALPIFAAAAVWAGAAFARRVAGDRTAPSPRRTFHRLRGGRAVRTHELGDRSRIAVQRVRGRSEEHTSELQSCRDLVCRLLLG